MKYFSNILFDIILQMILGFLCILLPTLVFIGMGTLFSKFFNLSLFQAIIACIGSAFVFNFFLFFSKEALTKKRNIWDEINEDLNTDLFNQEKTDLPVNKKHKKSKS